MICVTALNITAKICGVNAPEAVAAAISGGASHMGFNFYPPSPRYITQDLAATLTAGIPAEVCKVGVFVDADDDTIAATLDAAALHMLQLHGRESVQRVAELRARFGLPVMKAIPIADAEDIASARAFADVADWLLFDARPPAALKNALPGGNAVSFDWSLIAGHRWSVPWMLSGGLEITNIAEAAAVSGAKVVDVSSGIEDRRGHKSPTMIKAFLARVAGL